MDKWTPLLRQVTGGLIVIGILWTVGYFVERWFVQPTKVNITRKDDGEFSLNVELKDGRINFLDILDSGLQNEKDREKIKSDLKLEGFYETKDIFSLLKDYTPPFSRREQSYRDIRSVEDMEYAFTREVKPDDEVAKLLKRLARSNIGAFDISPEKVEISIPDHEFSRNFSEALACEDNQYFNKKVYLSNVSRTAFASVTVSGSRSFSECISSKQTKESIAVSNTVARCLLGKRYESRNKFEDARVLYVAPLDDTSEKVSSSGETKTPQCAE